MMLILIGIPSASDDSDDYDDRVRVNVVNNIIIECHGVCA